MKDTISSSKNKKNNGTVSIEICVFLQSLSEPIERMFQIKPKIDKYFKGIR